MAWTTVRNVDSITAVNEAPTLGRFADVSGLDIAGLLPRGNSGTKLYFRQEAVDLWNKLTASENLLASFLYIRYTC